MAEAFALHAAGHRLEAEWHGPRPDESPTLVLLHEGLGSVSTWKGFPKRLVERTGCGALVYSRWGYGQSDPVDLPRPLSYMHDEAEALSEVLDAAGVERCVLVGHSDGGSIALLAAARSAERERVRGAALLAAHVFCEEISVQAIERARAAFAQGGLRDALARHHADVEGAFRGWSGAWLDPGFRAWNLEGCLPQIRAPLLVIQGEDDPYGTLAQVDAIVGQSGGPAERLILPGVGHAPQREAPEETEAAIAACAREALGLGA